MSFYGWNNCPQNVKNQINSLVMMVKTVLEDQLIGLYLHGSLSMGCFNPTRSDLDFLVVTTKNLNGEIKRVIIEKLLVLSKSPCPIEISFLTPMNFLPWQFPTPFDLHYSEMWREHYRNQLANQQCPGWNEQINKDPDLAAHIAMVLNRGVCLFGKPAYAVFPTVPPEHFQASIELDYQDARVNLNKNPLYAVLTFCRVDCYLLEKRIVSKQEGAIWGMEKFPQRFRKLLAEVLAVYQVDMA